MSSGIGVETFNIEKVDCYFFFLLLVVWFLYFRRLGRSLVGVYRLGFREGCIFFLSCCEEVGLVSSLRFFIY